MIQIANGMKQLRKHSIVHRDLKPHNFLLSDNSDTPIIKIADFGFAKRKNESEQEELYETLCGTPMYMAPEIHNGMKYTEKADLWSIGVLLYEMVTGKPPFPGKNLLDLRQRIHEGKYTLQKGIKLS